MVQLSSFRLIETVAGISVSGPLFFLTLQAVQRGQLLFASGLLLVALGSFVLPGLLLRRGIAWVKRLQSTLVSTVTNRTSRLLSLIPFFG